MKNILWLDDDKNLLDKSEEVFRNYGFHIKKATNTSRALTILRTQKLDGVLLDVRLNAGENGLELLEEICLRYPDLKVVIFTAYPDYQDHILAQRLGASFYFEKLQKAFPADPAKLDEFFEALHQIFETKPISIEDETPTKNLFKPESKTPPDWDTLSKNLKNLPTGRKSFTDYENLIESILSAIFYPSLRSPIKQLRIHNGRKRIDLTYRNEATDGFFSWLAKHYLSAFIFIECKNYGKEIGNPELDQLAGRFSSQRGQFGILVCRTVKDISEINQKCIDTAKDQRGFIIVLTDQDIYSLIEEEKKRLTLQKFPILRDKFEILIK